MNSRLQETRKTEIPELIQKYKKLVDNIYEAVTKPYPKFKDFEKDGEIISTAEQQMYSFIGARNRALDNANDILEKINELENELHDPDYYKKQEAAAEPKQETSANNIKRYTKK